MDYTFYTDIYRGNSIPQGDFTRLALRASSRLDKYKQMYKITGDTQGESMAICAMADVIYYFEQTPQSTSIGSISTTERPRDEAKELYRAASTYLTVYRG